jgi:hypothetical protein
MLYNMKLMINVQLTTCTMHICFGLLYTTIFSDIYKGKRKR